MVFVCACIVAANGTSRKFLKPWYAHTILDGNQSLSNIFNDFASGEFDGTGVAIDDKYQSIQVSNYIF
jgi:hypothetical protein